MEERAKAAGLRFETVETFGLSYARTLAAWRTQFLDAWPRIAAQGFDERFRRMWLYYLGYCEAGFSRGTIDVGLYRVRKPA
jgi:cyclopropane-fatty-acyl-phospholipid synthase